MLFKKCGQKNSFHSSQKMQTDSTLSSANQMNQKWDYSFKQKQQICSKEYSHLGTKKYEVVNKKWIWGSWIKDRDGTASNFMHNSRWYSRAMLSIIHILHIIAALLRTQNDLEVEVFDLTQHLAIWTWGLTQLTKQWFDPTFGLDCTFWSPF